MNKRQQSAARTKKKLINAARTLLKEKGLSAINVEEITKTAGVAKAHFMSILRRKRTLFLNIQGFLFWKLPKN